MGDERHLCTSPARRPLDAYRDVRLAALRKSPKAFLATYAEETKRPERYWRNCMVKAHRLLAVRDEGPVGVASVEMIEGAPQSADFHDLWVTPEARNTGGVASGPNRRRSSDSGRLHQAVLLGQHRKRARDRVRHQCRIPFDVTTSDHTYQEQRIRRPGNRASAIPRQRPRCGGHLDTISAHLEARPPLTKHTGAYGRRGLMSVTSSTGDRLPGKTAFPTRRRCHQ